MVAITDGRLVYVLCICCAHEGVSFIKHLSNFDLSTVDYSSSSSLGVIGNPLPPL